MKRSVMMLVASALVCGAVFGEASAVAGSGAHGGGGFVCAVREGGEKAYLLDLWEAENIPLYVDAGQQEGRTLHIRRSDAPVEAQIREAFDKLKRIDRTLYDQVKEAYRIIRSKPPRYVGPDVKILPPSDARTQFGKEGCELQGIALYDDEHEVLTRKQIPMDPTEEAALYVHEAVYKAMRRYVFSRDSIKARHLTAYLFAEEEFAGPSADVPADALLCQNRVNIGDETLYRDHLVRISLYVFKVGEKTRYQFIAMNSLRTWTKTYFDLENVNSPFIYRTAISEYDSPAEVMVSGFGPSRRFSPGIHIRDGDSSGYRGEDSLECKKLNSTK
jgi:hypothetical protein